MEFEDALRIGLILIGGIALGIGLLWAIWAILAFKAWIGRRTAGRHRWRGRDRPARRSPFPATTKRGRKPQPLTDSSASRNANGAGAGPAPKSSDPNLPPLKTDGPFGNSVTDDEIRAVHAEHVRKYYTYDQALETLAGRRAAAGDLAGAALVVQEFISAERRCKILIDLAKTAQDRKDPDWLRYAEEAERSAIRLEEFLDPWFDGNSKMPYLRRDALDALSKLYRDGGRSARAIGVMTHSSHVSMSLYAIRTMLAAAADAEPLRPQVRLFLERLRTALGRGENPERTFEGEPEDPAKLRAALAETWAALGDLDEARRDLAEIPEAREELRRGAMTAITGVEPTSAAGRSVEPGPAAPAAPNSGAEADPSAPEARRWVSVGEVAEAVGRGDLDAAETLAELQLDTRKRQEYRRDVARAWLDRDDRQAAREVAERIETPALRAAMLREIDRVSEGGEPTPPAGDVVAIVVDNDQPGNSEKQKYVKGFQDDEQASVWAMRRVRASIERYRKPGRSAAEILALWRAGGENVKIGNRFPGEPWLEGWAETRASADDMDHESYTPRLF